MTSLAASTAPLAATAAERSLAAIVRRDEDVRAFVHVDPGTVRHQAVRIDAADRTLPLAGVSIGVKDVFDTSDAPTEHGSPIFRSHRPRHDAACVASLRAAGALIVGKTATAELACMHPPATRNPHDPDRTPGGSSSGSAAAVAAGMVDAALGTQTAGSISRPASFCGVVGYKPTFGLIPRRGVLECAQSLDTVGVLANDVPTAARVAAAMADDSELHDLPELTDGIEVALLISDSWAELAGSVAEAVAAAGRALEKRGATIREIDLPGELQTATDVHRVIMRYELARSYASLYHDSRDQLSDSITGMIEEGLAYSVADYARAGEQRRAITAATAALLDGRRLIVAPAANGEAPVGLDSTGDPACSAPWTMVGVPMVTVPIWRGVAGMPVGATVIGALGADRLTLAAGHAVRAPIAE